MKWLITPNTRSSVRFGAISRSTSATGNAAVSTSVTVQSGRAARTRAVSAGTSTPGYVSTSSTGAVPVTRARASASSAAAIQPSVPRRMRSPGGSATVGWVS